MLDAGHTPGHVGTQEKAFQVLFAVLGRFRIDEPLLVVSAPGRNLRPQSCGASCAVTQSTNDVGDADQAYRREEVGPTSSSSHGHTGSPVMTDDAA